MTPSPRDVDRTLAAGTVIAPQREEVPGPPVRAAPVAPAADVPWHALEVDDLVRRLAVRPEQGLSTAEIPARRAAAGGNEVAAVRPPSLGATVAKAVAEPFVLLLAAAGLLAVALGEIRDGLLVLAGLVPIVGASVVTEYRGERAMEALRAAAAPLADVRRDGTVLRIPAGELVPGDLVLLRAGDIVPADLRMTRSNALALDRSVITGESLPEPVSTDPDPAASQLADRRSMAWSGTAVVAGRGEGVAIATGAATQVGRIAARLGRVARVRSPLQRELDRLVRILLVAAITLIGITVGAALLRGETAGSAVLAGISAAIAAIPEEPPVLLAVILGLGAYRLLRKGVLVRRLSAQETLGAVDLILTDKTGTLTENRLTLETLLDGAGAPADGERRQELIRDALLAEADAWAAAGHRTGSFTSALRAAATDPAIQGGHGVELLEASPPSDDRRYSWTRIREASSTRELALGAPEAVLELLEDAGAAAQWRATAAASARAGRRLLLLAGRDEDGGWQATALLGFTDPLRDSTGPALRLAREAGIQVVMVTGDHPETAASIAVAAGLDAEGVITGAELDATTDDEALRRLPRLSIVARATPEQKLRLVGLARRLGRTVAVTGDGVNDAPALQAADVGIAMGSGTQVAREAADLVLGDDSFATLLGGLAEGRRIVGNVEKGLVFLTSTHVALLGFILIATIAGYSHPLLPLQILWLELFIDVAASIAFEREAADPDSMRTRPRPRGQPLLTRETLVRVAVAGGITAVAALVILVAGGGTDHARWVAFNALVLGQLARAWANRSLRFPVTRLPMNGLIAAACLGSAAIQLAIPFVPPLAAAFQASALAAHELALVLGIALAPAVVAQLMRRDGNRRWVA